LYAFLRKASRQFREIWCLSNDVAEWSEKLRQRHGLTRWFNGFVISGDVGSRKPDKEIYKALIERVNESPNKLLFVDDHEVNLDTASSLGMKTILFDYDGGIEKSNHVIARSFEDILG